VVLVGLQKYELICILLMLPVSTRIFYMFPRLDVLRMDVCPSDKRGREDGYEDRVEKSVCTTGHGERADNDVFRRPER
jgi:hypothetical protein